MHHDWIFDVLADLKGFALTNGLPALAAQVDAAMRVAEAELAAQGGEGGSGGGMIGLSRSGRPN